MPAFSYLHWTTPPSSVTYLWHIDIVFSVVMVGTKKVLTPFVISPVQLGVKQGDVISKWLQQCLMTISQSAKELHPRTLVVPCWFLFGEHDVCSHPTRHFQQFIRQCDPSQRTRSERCTRLGYFRTTLMLSRGFPLYPFSVAAPIIDRSPCRTGLMWCFPSTSSSTFNL